MDKLLNMLSGYLTAAQQTLQHYGPQVWSATLALIRFNAIFYLVLGFLLLLSEVGVVKVFKWAHQKHEEAEWGDQIGWEFAMVGTVILGAIIFVAALVNLLDITNWIGAFSPQLAVLYRVASKAGLL